jgi:hypothetical protein
MSNLLLQVNSQIDKIYHQFGDLDSIFSKDEMMAFAKVHARNCRNTPKYKQKAAQKLEKARLKRGRPGDKFAFFMTDAYCPL